MRGDVDFTISISPPKAAVIQSMPLWSENYVVAGRHDHPLLSQRLSLAAFCEAPQLSVNLPGTYEYPSPIDEALAHRELSRNVQMSVNQFSVATSILMDSDLIAALPARIAMTPPTRGKIAMRPLPFSVPDFVLFLSWHQRSNTSQAHQWMKQRIIEATTLLNLGADALTGI